MGILKTLVLEREEEKNLLRSLSGTVTDLMEHTRQVDEDVRQIKDFLIPRDSATSTDMSDSRKEEAKPVIDKDMHNAVGKQKIRKEITVNEKENLESPIILNLQKCVLDKLKSTMASKISVLANHQADSGSKLQSLNAKIENSLSKLSNIEEKLPFFSAKMEDLVSNFSNIEEALQSSNAKMDDIVPKLEEKMDNSMHHVNSSMLELCRNLKDMQANLASVENFGRSGRMPERNGPAYSPRFPRRSWNQAQPSSYSSSPCRTYKMFSDWTREFVAESEALQNKFIDSHCHIDFIFQKCGIQHMSYSEFRSYNKDSWPVNYEGCIAVFCRPWTFVDDKGLFEYEGFR